MYNMYITLLPVTYFLRQLHLLILTWHHVSWNFHVGTKFTFKIFTYNNLLKSAKHLATQSVLSWNHRSLAINDQYPVATPLAVPIQTDYAAGILGKYLKNTYPEAAGSYAIV